ncbi:DUF3999 domain-containing protein [Engelhardtia mirabilis]|uniref:DUF3999 domain-containing protein n=1 Tax=Engelhardtia mirabilis TaxID=2528011 RepID=A0A518BGU6_9BACT|nr:hypothetical protein Pla133_12670 [Planctomycetes bacterium Pla133]QDV00528.1 hypothetical protein Pla86_12670 [Planctomycetes bacterium Pla86]
MKDLALVAALVLLDPLATSSSQSPADTLRMGDLAYGIELTTTDPGPVQTLLLPEEVYRGIHDADLRDLRVFNADGEEVPHAVRALTESTTQEHGPVSLPLFAVHGGPTVLGPGSDLALRVRRSPDGRVLEVKASDSATVGDLPSRPVAAYILDAGQLQRPAVGLTLELPQGTESFLTVYALEASQDLTTWSTLVPEATVARLEQEGALLQQDHVAFPAESRPYLRVRWLDEPPPMAIAGVRVELAPQQGDVERRSIRLGGRPREAEPNVYDFPSAGPLPVNGVQVHLPNDNTLIQATLESARSEAGPWSEALRARFYAVSESADSVGEIVDVSAQNPPYDIRSRTDRWWRLLVEPQGGGLGGGEPELELFYYPQQLAFVARGAGPFTLGFGAREAPAARFDWSAVTQVLSDAERSQLPRQSVQFGPLRDLGGPSVLQAPIESSRNTYILWGVLILGVALLGRASWNLAQQLRSS